MLWARNSSREWFLAALFVFGVLLAGSDGEWFPVPNLVGVTSIGLCTFWGKQKVEDVKAGEVPWKKVRRICLGETTHSPVRPEPEIAIGLWETCQAAEGDLARIMWAGSDAGDGTRQVAH